MMTIIKLLYSLLWDKTFYLLLVSMCGCQKTMSIHRQTRWNLKLYSMAAQPAACEVIISDPRCNKLVSRLFEFLVFFYRLKYICHQNTPKLYLLYLLWAYNPKNCITNASIICQFIRNGSYPYKLATLRATISVLPLGCYTKALDFMIKKTLDLQTINNRLQKQSYTEWKCPKTVLQCQP